MPARAFGVALTPRPGCGAHAHHNFLARGVLSTIQPPPPPRVLPPPPSYGAASHVVLPLAHCPVFTTSRFRSRSLRISPLAFAAARAGRSRLPTAMSLRCPLLSPAIACPRLGLRTLHLYLAVTPPPVEIRDDHDVWRGGSLWRKEERTPECEREVKRCAQAFRAPASSEGKCCLPARQVGRSIAGVAVRVPVARLARPLGGLARVTRTLSLSRPL
jgi:hypothetical protein